MTAVAKPVAAGTPLSTPAAAVVPAAAAPLAPPAAGAVPVPIAAPVVPVAPVVPESYTLALPAQSLLEPKVTDRLTPLLKELKVVDHAVAQKVLDAVHGEASEVIRVYEAARLPGGEIHKAMVAGFTTEATADAFLGNGSLEALNALAQKAGELLAHYGPEYAARLKETGEAVHPSFLRMMKRLSMDYGERAQAGGPISAPARASSTSLFPDGVPVDTGASQKAL